MMNTSTSARVGIQLTFKAKSGQRDALVAHLLHAASFAENEPGTELFMVSIHPAEPNSVTLTEAYRSAEDKTIHESAAHYAAIRSKTAELTEGAPAVVPMLAIGGKALTI